MNIAPSLAADHTPALDRAPINVAIVGLGAIGQTLVRALAGGTVPGVALAGVAVRDEARGRAPLRSFGIDVPICELRRLPEIADYVVECAPAAVFDQVVRPLLDAGKRVIVLSVGAILSHPDLIDLARARGGQIIVPTGALLGLDAVCAAAEGRIHSVRMITRKPPRGLLGAPYLDANGISLEGLNGPKLVFSGTAREAAAGFPANVN